MCVPRKKLDNFWKRKQRPKSAQNYKCLAEVFLFASYNFIPREANSYPAEKVTGKLASELDIPVLNRHLICTMNKADLTRHSLLSLPAKPVVVETWL